MRKVLIVDDERLIREGLSQSIDWEEWGFAVSGAAANGEEALACMEAEAADVVITDVRMPVMDGIELCRILNRDYPKTRTIILSGYSEFEFAQKAIEYNVYAYLLKPLCEDKLSELFSGLRREMDIRTTLEQSAESAAGASLAREDMIDYLFLKLLSNNMDDAGACRDELQGSGYDTRGKYFNILAFEYGVRSEGREDGALSRKLLQWAKEYWGKLQYPVLNLDGTLHVVASAKVQPAKKDLHYYSSEFTNYLCEKLGPASGGPCRVSAGIGAGCADLRSLRQCSQQAREALRHKYYLGEGNVIFQEDIGDRAERKADEGQLAALTRDVAAGLLGQSQGTLLPAMKKLFGYVEALNVLDINRLCVRCIRIYASIAGEVKKEYAFINAPTEDEFYGRISRCRTFRTMAYAFEQTLREIEGQIGSYVKTSGRRQFIQRVKRYVQDHYGARLSLDQLSGEFFMNPSYLSRVFKEETGVNLSDYIQEVRIGQAKKMLRASNAKIQEISGCVGYEDYRHFCTVFKKATGLTPLQYRIR